MVTSDEVAHRPLHILVTSMILTSMLVSSKQLTERVYLARSVPKSEVRAEGAPSPGPSLAGDLAPVGDGRLVAGGRALPEEAQDVAGHPLDHGGLADAAGMAAGAVVQRGDPVVGAGVEHARAGGGARVVGHVGEEGADAGLAQASRDRRVAQDLVVGGLAVGLVELIDVGGDHAGDDLAVTQAGAGEDPGRGVGDPEPDVQAGLEEAGVGVPDEVVLGPAGRRVRPLVAGDLPRIALPVEGVGGRVTVVDQLTIGTEGGWLGADVPQHGAGSQED